VGVLCWRGEVLGRLVWLCDGSNVWALYKSAACKGNRQSNPLCNRLIDLHIQLSCSRAALLLARLTEVPQLSAADCTPTLSRTSRERSRGRATAAVKPRLPRGGSAVSAAPWARTGPTEEGISPGRPAAAA
jgi:hypothetical protein